MVLPAPSLRGREAWPLYVARFGEVGDERDHHPHVHARAYGDGERSQEQSPSGGDVGQREVAFVHRLGGLKRRTKPGGQRVLVRRSQPFFKGAAITEAGEHSRGPGKGRASRSHRVWRD